MRNILEINHLTKRFKEFQLQDINIALPQGSIMGFVGENGAGKSTTIKLILNLLHRDQGEIKIFGLDNIRHEHQIKDNIGVVFEDTNYPENMKATDIALVMKNIYQNWDNDVFRAYLKRFSLSPNKIIKEYSRGMKMKLSLAIALSHQAKLLILDEATSGLDPIVRDEILDIFLEFIQDEDHGIFISSHIVSDLEKVADYITFIHEGRIVLSEPKDNLLYKYGLLKCSSAEFAQIPSDKVIGYRKNNFGVEALVKKEDIKGNMTVDPVSIEEIMLFTRRGL